MVDGVVVDDGACVPPAIDAMACGVAEVLGGAGYVVEGPVPASNSADGSLLRANGFMLRIFDEPRHPAVANTERVHTIKTKPLTRIADAPLGLIDFSLVHWFSIAVYLFPTHGHKCLW
ncbi:hypothetical protein Pla22_00290 [Rubripirellula amarantea]|uniref:Uncharacterized protein n=1 Tax=Rubripirellula amarantea TaxID=2527999 RepID=A0A5C5WQ68_9BACT|nr:hypothetical protein Pla22_00290 [Rubripirellula amarantea]